MNSDILYVEYINEIYITLKCYRSGSVHNEWKRVNETKITYLYVGVCCLP